MRPTMRLGDAVADLRIRVEAIRTRVVAVIQNQRDVGGVEIFQILSGRLEVDLPRAAGIGRGSKRNDLGRHGARRFEREVGSVGLTPDLMRDVPRDRVGERKTYQAFTGALKNQDAESGRDEIVGTAVASSL